MGPTGADGNPAFAILNGTFVVTFPFLRTTSPRSMLIETTSTVSTLSPTPKTGFNIGLPGPGTIYSNTRGLERMLVIPVTSTVAKGAGGATGAGACSTADGGGLRLNGFLSTIHS